MDYIQSTHTGSVTNDRNQNAIARVLGRINKLNKKKKKKQKAFT